MYRLSLDSLARRSQARWDLSRYREWEDCEFTAAQALLLNQGHFLTIVAGHLHPAHRPGTQRL